MADQSLNLALFIFNYYHAFNWAIRVLIMYEQQPLA